MTRPRSSSARSNNSEARAPSASPRFPSSNPNLNDLTLPDGLLLDDIPSYQLSSSSNLLIPIYGTGSPYPTLASSSSPARPRGTTVGDTPPTPSYNPNSSYRPTPRGGSVPMFQSGQNPSRQCTSPSPLKIRRIKTCFAHKTCLEVPYSLQYIVLIYSKMCHHLLRPCHLLLRRISCLSLLHLPGP